jgi:Ca2+-binding RTX toxin-like protein
LQDGRLLGFNSAFNGKGSTMVFKLLFDGKSGDLYNAEDFFGYFDDTVYVVREVVSRNIGILTYRGNDLIECRDSNASNIMSIQAGLGNDTVLGGDAYEIIHDQSGNDLYSLGKGDDLVFGAFGNDTMNGGAGIDMLSYEMLLDDYGAAILATIGVRIDLSVKTVQNTGVFGRDVILNFENLTGGGGSDTLLGNAGKNIITAGEGNDLVNGRAGNDDLASGFGEDTLIGGLGVDVFYLGSGDGETDVVIFQTMRDSGRDGQPGTTDVISNFGIVQDRIDLSAIDARTGTTVNDSFVFRASGAFRSAKGEVRLVEVNGSTQVQIDTDADASAEMVFTIDSVVGLTAANFIL